MCFVFLFFTMFYENGYNSKHTSKLIINFFYKNCVRFPLFFLLKQSGIFVVIIILVDALELNTKRVLNISNFFV